jgi:CRISPR-associated protein Csb2
LFRSEVLSGKDASGQFLREHHHAFYLPAAEGEDSRWITHITVASTAGFDPDELAALAAVGRLKVDDESPVLRTQLIGLGNKQSLRASLLGEGNVWTSATPFVVTRHMKRRGQKRDPRAFFETAEGKTDFIKQVLREELERRGLYQDGVDIEMLESVGTAHRLRPIEFCLRRPHKPGDDGPSRPRGLFRLRFPQPVSGPIALGHSCHFGLGLFVPE